jgi:sterol desaturase/sphingolipid hydroxylase (fatty acid hydroxylase superfamily)
VISLSVIGATAGIVVALAGLERLWPNHVSQRPEWLNNGLALILTTLSQSFLVALIATSETGLVNALGGGAVDLRAMPFVLGAAIYVLAMDAGEYLFHRAQHAIPWLWAMHSLHHSDRAVNVLTTQRHFWLEPAIKSVTIWLAVALLFRADVRILAVYFVFAQYNFLSHSNLRLGFGPFSWLLNSPRYHRLHHSRDPGHYNSNFAAQFPIFDVLTGAYRRPRPGETPDTGLDESVERPLEVLVWPIRGLLARAPQEAVRDR